MKNLKNYITEAWSGVKRQTIKADIEAWCDEMGIKNYTINSKGEIDVNGSVWLYNKDFRELPYKFGYVSNTFSLSECKNLTSLKNCPNRVGESFVCSLCPQLASLENCPIYVGGDFWCFGCKSVNSLKGCPKEVKGMFDCSDCKRKFTEKEVRSLCTVRGRIKLTHQKKL